MRLLGGGEAYEAYLAFDEITYAPVVVKVLRPAQVTDGASLRGLRREVDRARSASTIPSWSGACVTSRTGRGRTWCSNTSTAHGSRR